VSVNFYTFVQYVEIPFIKLISWYDDQNLVWKMFVYT